MKRIIIGRANDCNIIIPDEHDNVSRHHAVITFDFFGRMTLSDTSSNGTLINGTKMLKGTSIPVTRKDKIQLGGAWMFDWDIVEDPYKSTRRICCIMFVVVLIAAIGGASWLIYDSYHKDDAPTIEIPKSNITNDSGTWNKDSTARVAPTETNIKTSETKKQKGNVSKGSTSSSKRTNTKVKKAGKMNVDRDLMRMKQRSVSERNSNNGEMPVIN